MTDAVLVGYIRTPEGRAALDMAVEETRRRRGRLVIVHSAKGGGHEVAEDVVNDRLALESIESALREDGLEVEVNDLARGNDPTEDLLAVASQVSASVIVIGMRRRTAVGKLLLGSNAQSILLSADCPVIAVKAAEE